MFELRNPNVFRDADARRLAVAGLVSLLFHAALLAGGNLMRWRAAKPTPAALQATLVGAPLPPPRELIAPEAPPTPAEARPAPRPEPKPRAATPARRGFTALDAAKMAQQQIARQLLYPEEAVARGLEGDTPVRLFFDESGAVIAARLEGTSGHELLDQAAIKAASGVRMPPGAPAEVSLTVRFRLR